MPENSRKKELLRLLEEKIWQEVVSHLPDSRMPTEEQISDPILLQNNHEWLHAYAKRDRNRLIERVRNSVIDTHSEQLLADITREPIMIFLDEIHNAIDVYPSPLSSYDEGTQEMGREYAHIFVQDWKYSFQTRVGFFRQYTTMEGSANG